MLSFLYGPALTSIHEICHSECYKSGLPYSENQFIKQLPVHNWSYAIWHIPWHQLLGLSEQIKTSFKCYLPLYNSGLDLRSSSIFLLPSRSYPWIYNKHFKLKLSKIQYLLSQTTFSSGVLYCSSWQRKLGTQIRNVDASLVTVLWWSLDLHRPT